MAWYDSIVNSVVSAIEAVYLKKNQGSSNSGKFLKVGSTGSVTVESVTIPSAYTHPSYTARTGKPTANQTPGFGGTFTVSQITSDTTGHVTGATDRTVTIPMPKHENGYLIFE